MKSIIIHSLACLFVALSVWPVFVVVAMAFSYYAAEGSMINTWQLEPKRNLLAHFLEGYQHSAAIAAVVAIFTTLCGLLRRGRRLAQLLIIVALPIAGMAITHYFYGGIRPQNSAVLLAFVVTGLILAILSLAVAATARSMSR